MLVTSTFGPSLDVSFKTVPKYALSATAGDTILRTAVEIALTTLFDNVQAAFFASNEEDRSSTSAGAKL